MSRMRSFYKSSSICKTDITACQTHLLGMNTLVIKITYFSAVIHNVLTCSFNCFAPGTDDAENITIQTVTQPGLELIFQKNASEAEARGSIATLEGLNFTLTPSEDSFTATPVFPGTPISPDLVPTDAPFENITEDSLQLWLENVTAVPSAEATGTVEEGVVPVTAAIDAALPEKPVSATGE